MTDGSRKRPALAAMLALIYPGLGHLYLRLWARSLMWFALVAASVVVLVPAEAAIEPAGGGAVAAAESVWAEMKALPLQSKLMLSTITAMEMLDAYMLARRERSNAGARDAGEVDGSCPSCGKDLDEELDFCPWCTERLDEGTDAASG
jgi:hypothetical protein